MHNVSTATSPSEYATDLFRSFLRENRSALLHIASWGDGRCSHMAKMCREELFGESREIPKALEGHVNRPISQKSRWRIFRRDGYQCLHCGALEDLTVDHIVPQIEGGTSEDDNLQTLCRTCNSKKGVRV